MAKLVAFYNRYLDCGFPMDSGLLADYAGVVESGRRRCRCYPAVALGDSGSG